ncbi:DUF4439 domain-containing protein [Kineococcus sp. R8]|nr:DUF4439 domain-containing protein [Kineococcus siccus]
MAAPPAAATTPAAASTPAAAPGEDVGALQRALAGEHEAVYAYGLLAARAALPRRPEALGDLDAHRIARDRLEEVVRALGAEPVAAAAGYAATAPTPEAAALLAATVEDRLSAVYEDVVGAGPARRELGAAGVLRAARAAVRWGGPVRSFPGLPALADDGGPAPAPAATTAPAPAPTPG